MTPREELEAAIAAYRENGGTITKCEPSKRGMRSRERSLTVRVKHRMLSPTQCQSHRGPKGITSATSVGLGKTVGQYNGIKYSVSKQLS
jgi:hypothetical protein